MIHTIKQRILTLLALLLMAAGGLIAQNPTSLYYLENLPQNNFVNAAMMPRCKAFVGFPFINSIYTSAHSDLAANDLLQKTNGQWLHPLRQSFDYNKLYKSVGSSVSFSSSEYVAPLFFGFRTGKGYVTFAMSEKIGVRGNIATDLFKIAENGFPDNSTFDLSSTSVKAMYYREISLGYAREINNKLTLGVHLKPLFGQGAIESRMDKLLLKTSKEAYSVDVTGDIYSSLPIDVEEGEDGLPENIEFRDMDAKEAIDQYGFNFSNPGLAIDLGGVYTLNENWSFSAALNNLGFISWKEDLHSISFNGKYSFDGPDLTVYNRDSIGDIMESVLDSMKNAISSNTAHKSFTSTLAPALYLGSSYSVNHVLGLGFLSRSTFEKHNFRQEFSLSANLNLYHCLTTHVNYNVEINGGNNIGMGLALRAGPVQFYFLADHIPLKYNIIDDNGSQIPVPMSMENASFMLGINFVFGANGYKNKPMLNTNSRF
ncbi:MAG: flagellar motor protein MotB [Marinilabiliaceae bacterium]|nr:flagellar motor protein MotB [Marinilabiliaceae bacterium]